MREDPYSILGVSRDATRDDIRRTYIAMIRVIHPDRFDPASQSEEWRQANELLMRVNAAYDLLYDPKRKASYDAKQQTPSSRAYKPPQPEPPNGRGNERSRKEETRQRTFAILAGISVIILGIWVISALSTETPSVRRTGENYAPSQSGPMGPQIIQPPNRPERPRRPDYERPSRPSRSSRSPRDNAGLRSEARENPFLKFLEISPLPQHAEVVRHTSSNAVAPLEIITSGGDSHFVVKLSDWTTDGTVLTVFVHGGIPADILVPLGAYRMEYAVGSTWYGYSELFGSETRYFRAEQKFVFSETPRAYTGYTVELVRQIGGNLRTVSMPPTEW